MPKHSVIQHQERFPQEPTQSSPKEARPGSGISLKKESGSGQDSSTPQAPSQTQKQDPARLKSPRQESPGAKREEDGTEFESQVRQDGNRSQQDQDTQAEQPQPSKHDPSTPMVEDRESKSTREGLSEQPQPQSTLGEGFSAEASPQALVSDGLIDLPSKYLVYGIKPEDFKLRPLKGKDEKIIASLTYENLETKFVEILKNVTVGIDPRELTLGDRLYIMLWLAINSYNKYCTVESTCTECYHKSEYEIDMSQFGVVELPSNFKEPYQLQLPLTRQTIGLRLFRAKDEERAVAFEKQTGQNAWLYRYAQSIVQPEMSEVDKIIFLEELPAAEVALIRAFHEKFNHGPKMETLIECQKCGGTGLVPVPFRIELFFPYGKTLDRYFGNAV